MAERNFSVVRDYVSSFNDSIRKRHLENWHLFRMVWTKSLEWHFTFYELELGAEGDTSSFNDPISQIKGIATKLLNDVFLRGIIDNNAFLCFKMLEQHAEGKQQLYLIELFHRISETFFENIYKSNEKYDIWNSYFPRDWLITKANLDARKPVVMVLWERFINW
jgi:hypothetical protein